MPLVKSQNTKMVCPQGAQGASLAGQAFADISLQHCRKGIPVFWEEQRRTLIAAD
jgi:hypothetical protein